MSGNTLDVDALLAESDSRQRRNLNGNDSSSNGAHARRPSREGDDYISLKEDKYRERGRERGRSRSPDSRRRSDRSRSPRGPSRRDDNYSHRHSQSHRDAHPRDDRRYGRRYDDRSRDYRPRYNDPRSSRQDRSYGKDREPGATKSHTDAERHTLFVSQCAARVNSPELMEVFRGAGLDVANAEMVRDRTHSRNPREKGRHKGMAYVDFKTPEGAAAGLNLTGKVVLGVPLMIQVTEAEKNNQAKVSTENLDGAPFHRLYITNMSYSVTDDDMLSVLSAYGEVADFHVDREEGSSQNKGSCWVEYVDPNHAKVAYAQTKDVDLGGRVLRLGFGNSKVSESATKRVLDKWDHSMSELRRDAEHSPKTAAGNAGSGLRRSRPIQQGGPSSALDDSEAYARHGSQSRYSLMQKLNRTAPSDLRNTNQAPAGKIEKPQARQPMMVTRGLKIQNVFDPKKVEKEGPDFFEELRSEIEQECAESYGPVTHSAIAQNSDGDGYVKFAESKDTKKAFDSLNGRFFAGLRLSATYIPDAVYNSLYPKSG